MRKSLASAMLLAGSSAASFADCLKETTLPGYVAARTTAQRSFTISRPGASISVMTFSNKDKLSFRVLRPNGSVVCNKGPASELNCAPDFTSKKREGVYRIFIANRMARGIDYELSCANPP